MFASQAIPTDGFSVTKSDTQELPNNFVGFYVGGTGNVAVLTSAGRTIVFNGLPAGALIPIRARRIMSTSTTATNIIGLLGLGK